LDTLVADFFANLTDKKAVITGSSSGIGRAIAMLLAEAGADVVVHCNTSVERANDVAAAIRNLGRQAEVCTANLAIESVYEGFVERAWNVFGSVDVWVNNAGVDLLTGEAAQLGYSQKLQQLFDIDIRSTILLSRAVGLRMTNAGSGVIINIGWDQADRGMAGDSGEMFAASKNAIMGFTRSLAVSLAPTVRVNCVAPGWIKTAWGDVASDDWQQRVLSETPLQRWGTPDDVARTVRFLASSDADFITGQIINVNGGAVR
jgi:3-oxoacyl-[acyl-carrier protein] reductase